MAAAKEFNIGKDTLVDFLVAKGFDKDELKPTSKVTEEMYRALQNEFQSDKVAKLKSIQIDLPKGAVAEAKKKKDEINKIFTWSSGSTTASNPGTSTLYLPTIAEELD